jgi:hypothetical protein
MYGRRDRQNLRSGPHAFSVDTTLLKRAIGAVPLHDAEATVLDIKVEADFLNAGYLWDAERLSVLGFVAIVSLLCAALRSVRRVFRVIAPLILAVLTVMTVLSLMGKSLTMLHLIGLLLTTNPAGVRRGRHRPSRAHEASRPSRRRGRFGGIPGFRPGVLYNGADNLHQWWSHLNDLKGPPSAISTLVPSSITSSRSGHRTAPSRHWKGSDRRRLLIVVPPSIPVDHAPLTAGEKYLLCHPLQPGCARRVLRTAGQQIDNVGAIVNSSQSMTIMIDRIVIQK